jgi:hypothetical protein
MVQTRLNRFIGLPAHEKWLLLEATLELARASIALRLLPWRRVGRAWMTVEGGQNPETARSIGDSIRLASRYAPWNPTCLRQALALQRMLRRRQLAGRIQIGFPDPKNKTHAHAWVLSGQVQLLNGPI